MHKKIVSISSLFIFYLFAVTPAHAINPCPKSNNFKAICNYDLNTLGSIITNAVTVLFVIATLLSLFFLVTGGIKWITSGGDKSQVEAARNWIIAAVVGLVITFLSYFILSIVLNFFGIDLGKNLILKIPDLVSP